ncbi:anti-anti-sigma factor [Krasilnikovia cinnamomea]|uniref:Anti-anti-sigma factor n=1 Tax=Krasilnikovia cinnamomea TaxID=349313 RepID=A0A4Q7ZRU4_9ACTN|nr:STAS domain-containing protein [Krasilnikovia cinnamomea]RZU53878.1 anti-anti-sigma factor [Krasilnikovia cinnamomea]
MSAALTLATGRRSDGAFVLTATGEIDMSNADAFATALAGAHRDADGAPFVVDLTGVAYLDSAGLAALLPHVEHVHLLATPLIGPVLTIAGLAELTTIHDQ